MAKKNKKNKVSPSGHQCRVCGQAVVINPNGTVKLHNAQGRKGVVPCPGAGIKVAPPQTEGVSPRKRPKEVIQQVSGRPDRVKVAKRVKELLNPRPRNTQGDEAAADLMRSGRGSTWRLGKSPRHRG